MKKHFGWVSEYQKKKFYERQKLKKEKEFFQSFESKNDVELPKTIAVMLDLDGTCDFLNDSKAKIFIAQLDKLQKKFEAKKATISISTHHHNSDKMHEPLKILSRNLTHGIEIGINFFYGGIYDYEKQEEIEQGYNFNHDKVKTFDTYYISDDKINNQWFAIIDDSISENIYRQYQNIHPMLVCRPSQKEKDSLSKNNFMNMSTTTKGFDGVIEVFDFYIEAIKHLTPNQIKRAQRNMITHLSSWDLSQKVKNHEYDFLEKYFKEGCADEGDFRDTLNWLMYIIENQSPSKNELIHLQRIFRLMLNHFREINEQEAMGKVLKLQKTLETNS